MPTPLWPLGARSPLRDAKLVSKASLAGTLYDLGDYPGILRNSNQRRVLGELFELDESRGPSILRHLDEYEGPEFVRQRGFVTQRDGKRRLAWFYVLRKPPNPARIISSGRFRQRRPAA